MIGQAVQGTSYIDKVVGLSKEKPLRSHTVRPQGKLYWQPNATFRQLADFA